MALTGVKVIEFAGLAPGPFAGLILADNGASVTRIDRPSSPQSDILCRGKRSLAINLKIASGLDVLRKLVAAADVVIDPFRPGVMEKLGLGPEVFLGSAGNGGAKSLNEKLIYARIVGFPRTGPHKDMAGHDINYLALSGILSMLPGSVEKPTFPLNLIADFAGGGLACATGILLALVERAKSGRGQVVNTDMVSGARYLASFSLLLLSSGSPSFSHERGNNILDGGAPFYDVYTCKDGRGWMSVGCLEPRFFAVFLEKFLDALPSDFYADGDGWKPMKESQYDRGEWPKLRAFLRRGFSTNSRGYWTGIFHGSDACTVPVLTPFEAAALDPSHSPFPTPHPYVNSRRRSTTSSGTSETLTLLPGQHTQEVLQELGLNARDRRRLALDGALGDKAQAEARGQSKL